MTAAEILNSCQMGLRILARKLARNHPTIEPVDLEQDGAMAIFERADRFDASLGYLPWTFFQYCAESAMRSAIQTHLRIPTINRDFGKHARANSKSNVRRPNRSHPLADADGSPWTAERVRELCQEFGCELNQAEISLLVEKFDYDAATVSELAESRGVDRVTIHRRLKAILDEIRSHALNA